MLTFAIGIAVLVLMLFILFGGSIFSKLRTLIRGFVGLFVEDLAKTPEGAEAVYNQAIDEQTDKYRRANNTLQRIAGQLTTAKDELTSVKKDLADNEKKCETFAAANQWDKAQLYATKVEDLRDDVKNKEELVAKIEPMLKEAEMINQTEESRLDKIKREKKKIISELKLNKQLKEVYDDMDELKQNNGTDKLLNAVKEGAKESREIAVGAREVHENKLSTKISRADDEAKKLQSTAYLDELKKKYQK